MLHASQPGITFLLYENNSGLSVTKRGLSNYRKWYMCMDSDILTAGSIFGEDYVMIKYRPLSYLGLYSFMI